LADEVVGAASPRVADFCENGQAAGAESNACGGHRRNSLTAVLARMAALKQKKALELIK